ncbi:MAG: alpha/beta hydrolase, partial [Proteobacteria bacterium]|nr:alpha/beta hydrolase [Pseudomonadota bacterium]
VALETGHYFAEKLRGVIFMDFTVAPPDQYLEWGMRAEREGVQPARKLRVYEDRQTIIGRFRLLPDQPGVYPQVLQHMAENGIKQVEGGWTWKFDPALFDHLEMGVGQRDKFASMNCRSAVILAEQSDDEGAYFADHMAEITGGLLPIFKIPGTHHHLMFDEPLAVAMALKAIALDWIREDGATQIRERLNHTLNTSNQTDTK